MPDEVVAVVLVDVVDADVVVDVEVEVEVDVDVDFEDVVDVVSSPPEPPPPPSPLSSPQATTASGARIITKPSLRMEPPVEHADLLPKPSRCKRQRCARASDAPPPLTPQRSPLRALPPTV